MISWVSNTIAGNDYFLIS